MTYIPYHTPLRSSAPQERWRAEADAAERKRATAAAEARRQWQTQEREAAKAAERTPEAQIAALRVELEQQHDVRRDAMVEFVVREFEEFRIDVERSLKRKSEELQRLFETKLAALEDRAIPGARGEQGECGPMGPQAPSHSDWICLARGGRDGIEASISASSTSRAAFSMRTPSVNLWLRGNFST